MVDVFLDPDGGEVWLHVVVRFLGQWVFDMDLTATRNITPDIPPIQGGPDARPLGMPGTLTKSGASWNTLLTNLLPAEAKNKQDYTVEVYLHQIQPDGTKMEVYKGPKQKPGSGSIDPSQPGENPRLISEDVFFFLKP